MKAYVVHKPGDSIQSIEVSNPQPGTGEVQVSVKGSSVNPADIKVATGGPGSQFIHSRKAPIRLGFDFSGVISKLGAGVTLWKIGDEVYGHLPYSAKTVQGSYSEYVTVTEFSIASKPKKLNHTEAGTVPTVGNTALQSLLNIGKIKPGMKVLINGASGGVGCYATQLAKSFGAEVWGTASSKNQEFIVKMGVDYPMDYKKKSVAELDQKFDIFFDVTSNMSFTKCQHILNPRGVYITLLPGFSFLTGLLTSLFSSKKCKMCMVKSKNETLARLTKLIDEEKINVPIAASFELERNSEALDFLAKTSVPGKIAIST